MFVSVCIERSALSASKDYIMSAAPPPLHRLPKASSFVLPSSTRSHIVCLGETRNLQIFSSTASVPVADPYDERLALSDPQLNHYRSMSSWPVAQLHTGNQVRLCGSGKIGRRPRKGRIRQTMHKSRYRTTCQDRRQGLEQVDTS